MYNKVFLEGNLTRDIEMKNTSSGLAVASSAIATNRKFKSQTGEQKEEILFVDITFFGRTAEIAKQYLRKGSNVLVDGRLQLDQWTDQSGQKRSKHSVVVETLQMINTNSSIKINEPEAKYSPETKSPTEYQSETTQQATEYIPEPP